MTEKEVTEKVEEKKVVPGRYELVEVPTETELAVRDTTNPENVYTKMGLLVKLANEVEEIKKAIVGV